MLIPWPGRAGGAAGGPSGRSTSLTGSPDSYGLQGVQKQQNFEGYVGTPNS